MAELVVQIVADAFAVFERAVFAPELAGLPRHAGISGEVLLGNGQDESIYIMSHILIGLMVNG
jgi:hypothetical protein